MQNLYNLTSPNHPFHTPPELSAGIILSLSFHVDYYAHSFWLTMHVIPFSYIWIGRAVIRQLTVTVKVGLRLRLLWQPWEFLYGNYLSVHKENLLDSLFVWNQ